MTVYTENVAFSPPKSTKFRNSISSVQIQIKPKFQLELVPRDAKKSEFLDSVDFGCVAILVENVMLDQMVVNVSVPAGFAIAHAPSCTASCSRLIRHTPSQKAYVNIFVYVHAYSYEIQYSCIRTCICIWDSATGLICVYVCIWDGVCSASCS